MPLEPEFRSMMTSTVIIEPYAGVDAFNKPTYGPAVSYWSYVEQRIRYIRDASGKQVVSMSKVSMDPTAEDGLSSLVNPSPRSRITLPDGTKPVILSVATSRDEIGVHHYVFYC